MTYILGARCKDGVVLVADRKVTYDDGSVKFEAKLFNDFPPIVFGASGSNGTIGKFRDRLIRYCNDHASGLIDNYIKEMEDNTLKLNNEYHKSGFGEIDVLVGMNTNNGAVLEYIPPDGRAEVVHEYRVIGVGEPYGTMLLKILWKKDMTMRNVFEIGYLVVKCFENLHLNDKVGVGEYKPQIWFIPDKQNPHQADNTTLAELEEQFKSKLETLKCNIRNVFT